MATDLTKIVKHLASLPSSSPTLSSDTAAHTEVQKALQRNVRVVRARPFYGANATQNTAETSIMGTLPAGYSGNTKLAFLALRSDGNKSAHDTNNATIVVKKRWANGTAVTVASFNTATVSGGGTGDLAAFVAFNVSSNATFFNAANATTDPGGCFTITATKASSGLDIGDVAVEAVYETF